jgi:hypothetical protein
MSQNSLQQKLLLYAAFSQTDAAFTSQSISFTKIHFITNITFTCGCPKIFFFNKTAWISNFSMGSKYSVHPIFLYTGRNWKVRTNFVQEFHRPKIKNMSACDRKHVICGLWLKEFIYNKCSKCFVGDCSVCSHVLPDWLIGNQYRDFLLHYLPKLLESVALSGHECGTRLSLRWIGRGGPIARLPLPPEFNTLDI